MRMGLSMAVMLAGGLLLAPEPARASEGPGNAARSPLEELDALMAAKCKCGSAADCTCKKGTCECAKCKRPKRRVVDMLRDEGELPKVREARHDATGGVFI